MSSEEEEMRKKPRRMGIEVVVNPTADDAHASPAKQGLHSTSPLATLLALKKPALQTHASGEAAPGSLIVAWSSPAPISQLIGLGEPPGQ